VSGTITRGPVVADFPELQVNARASGNIVYPQLQTERGAAADGKARTC
jgi:hypothetical protein